MSIRTVADIARNEPGLVDKFIGTAYDTVKSVADALPTLTGLPDIAAQVNLDRAAVRADRDEVNAVSTATLMQIASDKAVILGYKNDAFTSSVNSANSAIEAHNAAAAATVAAKIFRNQTEGLNATHDGEYFNVTGGTLGESFAIQFYNDNGNAVLVNYYPSKGYIDSAVSNMETMVSSKAMAAALGLSGSATAFGQFTGGLLPDNATAATLFQTIETKVEADSAQLSGVVQALSTETQQRVDTDNSLNSLIAAEITNRTNAVADETANRIDHVNGEASARYNADQALQANINAARKFTGQFTGAVERNLSDKIGEMVITVSDAGGDYTGNTSSVAAIQKCDAAAAFRFTRGQWLIDSDVTITRDVIFDPGAYINVTNGATVVFRGDVQAGLYQIFAGTASSRVNFDGKVTMGYPEWWGARINNIDYRAMNTSAINICLQQCRVTILQAGTYHTSDTIILNQNYRTIMGAGRDKTTITLAHATSHVMVLGGVRGSYYAERPYLFGFTLNRSVSAQVPGNANDDAWQGHGLHSDMTSNAVVNQVDTGGNLVGQYWANCLSPLIEDCFDYMSNPGDRKYSWMIDGTQSPGGGISFPSLIVFRADRLRQSNATGDGLCQGLLMLGSFTDCQVDRVETASCHWGCRLLGTGSNAHFNSHWHDAYKYDGVQIERVSPGTGGTAGAGESIIFNDLYAAPGGGATGFAVYAHAAQGLQVLGCNVTSYNGGGGGGVGVKFSNCVGSRVTGNVLNHPTGVFFDACFSCHADVNVNMYYGAGDSCINITGGSSNSAKASIAGVSGSVNFSNGIKMVSTGNAFLDVSNVLDSAVSQRILADGVVVSQSGKYGSNFIIYPGANVSTS